MTVVSEAVNVLLINGHRKSGTTMTSLLFDGHPQVLSIPSDLNSLYAYYPRWCHSDVDHSCRLGRYQLVTIDDWLSSQAINGEEYERGAIYIQQNRDHLVTAKTVTAVFDFTVNLIQHIRDHQASLIVCKETSSEIYQSLISQTSRHNVKSLTVFRDPRDNVAALKRGSAKYYAKLGDSWHSTLMSALFRIQLSHLYGYADSVRLSSVHRHVRYEDLCFDTSEVLDGITEWLDLDFDSSLLVPTQNGNPFRGNTFSDESEDRKPSSSVNGMNIGTWHTHLTEPETAMIELFLQPMFLDLRYSLSLSECDYADASEMYAAISSSLFFSDRFLKNETEN
jgi:hypothetical protein